MRRDGTPRGDGRDRGQTTLDFAIGVGVFLIALAFTLTFVPGLFEPFVGSTAEETVAVNRVADALANGMLADPSDPRVLQTACTVAFFESENNDDDGSDTFPSGCSYESTDDLAERVGLQARPAGTGFDVRVSVLGEDGDGDGTVDPLCEDTDPTPHAFVNETDGACDSGSGETVLEVGTGDPPDATGSIVVARRGVHIPHGSGVDATLRVEVWS